MSEQGREPIEVQEQDHLDGGSAVEGGEPATKGVNPHAVKLIKQDDTTAVIGGYGVVFGGTDLEGDTFTPDTDFMLDLVPKKLVFIDHSLPSYLETKDGQLVELSGIDNEVGEVLKVTPDDHGLYMELMLNKASDYWRIVEGMLESKRVGLSSGSIPHLVRREGKTITRWPIVEESLTLTPAEPRTVESVARLKALAKANPDLEALFPEAARKTATDDAMETGGAEAQETSITILSDEGENTMSEETQGTENAVSREEFDALNGNVAQTNAAIAETTKALNALVEQMTKSGPLKDAGYIAPDSEADHAETKSFADWLLAVKRGNYKRLQTVYASKAMSGEDGTSGGYLVPEDYEARLLEVAAQHGVVRQRAMVQPVGTDTGRIPALNQYSTPSGDGETAFAGGVVAGWVGESASIGETTPSFKMLQWNIHKLAGYTKAPNELIADAAIGVEALLTRLFGVAIAAHEDRAFLRGDGAGKPLGILNAPALITGGSDDGNFTDADAVDMLSHFLPVGGSPVWLMNRSVLPDLQSQFNLTITGADNNERAGAFVNPREGIPQGLLGYPIVYTEMLPVADNTGDVLLADLQGYIIFDRAGLAIAFSEHANFLTDEGTWRFTKRMDGQPWLTDSITQNDGSHKLSPFVAHLD